jgi:LAO/AO transport system kinase
MAAEIVAMQGLGSATEDAAAVVQTVATTGAGTDELMAAVAACGERKRRREIPDRALDGIADQGAEWMRGLALDHLGIAVKSIAGARGFYEALGMRAAQEETVEQEQVKVAMLPVGASRIELLEPTAEDSVIGRFLAKRGEGLHHIALKVEDIEGMLKKLKEGGVRLVNDRIGVGAGGHRYFFVHPASTGGVLVEIVGKK